MAAHFHSSTPVNLHIAIRTTIKMKVMTANRETSSGCVSKESHLGAHSLGSAHSKRGLTELAVTAQGEPPLKNGYKTQGRRFLVFNHKGALSINNSL